MYIKKRGDEVIKILKEKVDDLTEIGEGQQVQIQELLKHFIGQDSSTETFNVDSKMIRVFQIRHL